MKSGEFPINLKFLIEGEEEIGSLNFPGCLKEQKDRLQASFALNADTGMIAKDVPTIVFGLRGLAYFEIRVNGPSHDLHSGVYGGVVQNPAQVLADLISGMRDQEGVVKLPGFYDKVLPLSSEERIELNRLNMNEAYYQQQTGVPAVWGEKGYTPVERTGARPTLDVNGLLSGFTGEGAKTVIPAWAMAKLSTRLVPNQKPDDVHQQLIQYIKEHAPATVTWSIKMLSGGDPSISEINTPECQALAESLRQVWGVKPTYKREGGSVPVVADMQQILGFDSVLTGFGLPDDNIHSPNEKLHLPTWYKGMEALIRFFFIVRK
jgi:acetylornithine deacetylase/succinyl-diaminopimelate desuccinylase-like protein